jgi:PRTRC genetic system protein C
MDDERDIETDETELDERTETLEAETAEDGSYAPVQEAAPVDDANLQRVFKVGSVRLPESDVTRGKSLDDVKKILKSTYPEVANATVREGKENGVHLIEFLPQPGRKG